MRAGGTPDWMAVGRSGAACSAVSQGRQTQCGGDGRKADPLEGKPCAQMGDASGIKAQWPSLGTMRGVMLATQKELLRWNTIMFLFATVINNANMPGVQMLS